MGNFSLSGNVKSVIYILGWKKGKKLKDNSLSPQRTTPYVIKSHHKAAALSSNSGEMGKVQQKDANTNGFCNNLLWVKGSFDKANVFPKERRRWFLEFKNCLLINLY